MEGQKGRGSEMPQFIYGQSTIDYTLTYVPEKNEVRITVDWIHGVNVFAPPHLSSEELDQILHRKAPWILKKVSVLAEIHSGSQHKEFLSGEKFPYLGRNYKLKVKRGNVSSPTLNFQLGCFLAEIPKDFSEEKRKSHVKRLLREWYIIHGEKKLKERLRIYSPRMELFPSKLTVTEHRMRWGSCTKKGAISIDWRVLMAPMRIVDYVLVHELAHLKHMNHSADFWRLIQSVIPDYEARKEWLRIHGPTLTF